MAMPNENRADLVAWARFGLEKIPPDDFLEITDETLLRDAVIASNHLRSQLVPGADPYLPGRMARHCVYFGEVERMGHTFAVDGLWLSILESPMFSLVRPGVELGPPEGHLEAAQQIANLLFRAANFAPLRIMPLKAADESMRLSTMPVQAMGMPPPGTIDGGVAGGRLYFLLHKHPNPMSRAVGYAPPTGWLSSRLRAAWDARPGPR